MLSDARGSNNGLHPSNTAYTDQGKREIPRTLVYGACGEVGVQFEETTALVNGNQATSGRSRRGVTSVPVLPVGLNDRGGAGKAGGVVEHVITQRPHD